jgi:hypothetical protein
MLDASIKEKIYKAFKAGTLKVESCGSDGTVRQSFVADAVRHDVSAKKIFKVSTSTRSVTATEDHSLFAFIEGKPKEALTGSLKAGDTLAVVENGVLMGDTVVSIEEQPSCTHMYDLSVPGDQNFVLDNGILAHNTYSISGVTLDLEKSSKYMSMKENLEQEFDKLKDLAKQSIKIVKGLKQPRYGIGISAALGPFSRVGVQSRRNYVSGAGGGWG